MKAGDEREERNKCGGEEGVHWETRCCRRVELVHSQQIHEGVRRKRRQRGGSRINLLTQQVCHAVSLLGGPFQSERRWECQFRPLSLPVITLRLWANGLFCIADGQGRDVQKKKQDIQAEGHTEERERGDTHRLIARQCKCGDKLQL